jgi:hypothetical protein
LIDTSVWFDLAERRDGQKWIVPLRVLKSQGKLDLLAPLVVVEEFNRNRPRSESAVTTRVLGRLRQLRRELREYVGAKQEHIWLAETVQHIPLVNAMAPQNFREIDELLRDGKILEPAEPEYVRAVQRGPDKGRGRVRVRPTLQHSDGCMAVSGISSTKAAQGMQLYAATGSSA